MGLRILPLLALALLATACAAGAGAQHEPSTATTDVTLVANRSVQGARVRLTETVTRSLYTVAGTTAAEIRSHLLDEAASGGPDGRRYDGLTTWSVHWTFRYEHGAGGCSLLSANLDVAIEIRLPRLADETAVAPAILDSWRAYAGALEQHETGHADRESAVLEGLRDAFESAPSAAECGGLGAALNALGDDFVMQVRLSDDAYDAETDHGRSQGAVFP